MSLAKRRRKPMSKMKKHPKSRHAAPRTALMSQKTGGKQKEPHPGAVHNFASSVGVRCVGPHFTNGLYTLRHGRNGYWPDVTGSEAMDICQEVQDARR
jgi:hypothetical protein